MGEWMGCWDDEITNVMIHGSFPKIPCRLARSSKEMMVGFPHVESLGKWWDKLWETQHKLVPYWGSSGGDWYVVNVVTSKSPWKNGRYKPSPNSRFIIGVTLW